MKKLLLISIAILTLFSCIQTDNTFKLEKIIFHTSVCFGACPVYHLQVDKDKNIKLYAEKNFQKDTFNVIDTARTGYFTGTVSDTSFNKLITQLQTIGLDTLEFDGATCCDGSLKTIIIYYDGKRKYLKSMFPPEKAKPLIATLYEICQTPNLRKTEEKFDIEQGDK